ncbi:uncharacterized protein [Hyperolius riggenbachi]|uniref:uncharacterized protein n=1 Tax=Hyperolius riggenbachi TaxID=752182 RepID=UPI0035A32B85
MRSCLVMCQLLLLFLLGGQANEVNAGSLEDENPKNDNQGIDYLSKVLVGFNPSSMLAFVPVKSCHTQLDKDFGTFSPPVFYGNMDVNLWCNWTILAAPGKHIVIYIEGFGTNTDCEDNHDEIIFEGLSSPVETSIVYACWNKRAHVFATQALAVNVVLLWRPNSSIGLRKYFEGRYYIFDDPAAVLSSYPCNCSLKPNKFPTEVNKTIVSKAGTSPPSLTSPATPKTTTTKIVKVSSNISGSVIHSNGEQSFTTSTPHSKLLMTNILTTETSGSSLLKNVTKGQQSSTTSKGLHPTPNVVLTPNSNISMIQHQSGFHSPNPTKMSIRTDHAMLFPHKSTVSLVHVLKQTLSKDFRSTEEVPLTASTSEHSSLYYGSTDLLDVMPLSESSDSHLDDLVYVQSEINTLSAITTNSETRQIVTTLPTTAGKTTTSQHTTSQSRKMVHAQSTIAVTTKRRKFTFLPATAEKSESRKTASSRHATTKSKTMLSIQFSTSAFNESRIVTSQPVTATVVEDIKTTMPQPAPAEGRVPVIAQPTTATTASQKFTTWSAIAPTAKGMKTDIAQPTTVTTAIAPTAETRETKNPKSASKEMVTAQPAIAASSESQEMVNAQPTTASKDIVLTQPAIAPTAESKNTVHAPPTTVSKDIVLTQPAIASTAESKNIIHAQPTTASKDMVTAQPAIAPTAESKNTVHAQPTTVSKDMVTAQPAIATTSESKETVNAHPTTASKDMVLTQPAIAPTDKVKNTIHAQPTIVSKNIVTAQPAIAPTAESKKTTRAQPTTASKDMAIAQPAIAPTDESRNTISAQPITTSKKIVTGQPAIAPTAESRKTENVQPESKKIDTVQPAIAPTPESSKMTTPRSSTAERKKPLIIQSTTAKKVVIYQPAGAESKKIVTSLPSTAKSRKSITTHPNFAKSKGSLFTEKIITETLTSQVPVAQFPILVTSSPKEYYPASHRSTHGLNIQSLFAKSTSLSNDIESRTTSKNHKPYPDLPFVSYVTKPGAVNLKPARPASSVLSFPTLVIGRNYLTSSPKGKMTGGSPYPYTDVVSGQLVVPEDSSSASQFPLKLLHSENSSHITKMTNKINIRNQYVYPKVTHTQHLPAKTHKPAESFTKITGHLGNRSVAHNYWIMMNKNGSGNKMGSQPVKLTTIAYASSSSLTLKSTSFPIKPKDGDMQGALFPFHPTGKSPLSVQQIDSKSNKMTTAINKKSIETTRIQSNANHINVPLDLNREDENSRSYEFEDQDSMNTYRIPPNLRFPPIPGYYLFQIIAKVKPKLSDVSEREFREPVKTKIEETLPREVTLLPVEESMPTSSDILTLTLWLYLSLGNEGLENFADLEAVVKSLEGQALGSVNGTLVSLSVADVNECQLGREVCDIKARCVNSFGTYSCHCKSGYEDRAPGTPGTACIIPQPAAVQSISSSLEILIASTASAAITMLLVILVLCIMQVRRHVKDEFRLQHSPRRPQAAHLTGASPGERDQTLPRLSRHVPPGGSMKQHTDSHSSNLLDLVNITYEQTAC